MKVDEADITPLLRKLETARTNGLNWISFDISDEAKPGSTELRFFESANDANTYCEPGYYHYFPQLDYDGEPRFAPDNSFMAVKTLRNRLLYGETGADYTIGDLNMAKAALDAQNVSPVFSPLMPGDEYYQCLLNNEFCPVVWKKQITPENEIESYHVIRHQNPKGQIYEIGHEVQRLESFTNYHEAYHHLLHVINHPLEKGDDYLLAGLYRGKDLHLDMEGHPHNASGIVLVTAIEQRDDLCYHLYFPNDRLKPTTIEQVLFGSYNAHSNELSLFDDKLNKATPDTVTYNIYANHFDSGRSINIQNTTNMEEQKALSPLEKIQESVMYAGFDTTLNDALAEKVAEGVKEFSLPYKLDDTEYNLHFKKSDTKDAYYFNKYDATLLPTDKRPMEVKQTFYHDQNITAIEANNLLNGRSVNKNYNVFTKTGEGEDVKYEWTPETYNTWVKLDFDKQDKNGNYELVKRSSFDLQKALKEHPIIELNNPDKLSKMTRSLQKGNLTKVTLAAEGKETPVLISADAQFKKIQFYHKNGVQIFQKNKAKEKNTESQQTGQTPIAQTTKAAEAKSALAAGKKNVPKKRSKGIKH